MLPLSSYSMATAVTTIDDNSYYYEGAYYEYPDAPPDHSWIVSHEGKAIKSGHRQYEGLYKSDYSYTGIHWYTGWIVNNNDKRIIYIESYKTNIRYPANSNNSCENNRITTGVGQSRSFKAGQSACGYKIVFDNGKPYEGGYGVINSPYAGIVTDGVVNPTNTELAKVKIIDPKFDKPDNSSRVVTSGQYNFSVGDTFIAREIHINGKTFYNKLIVNSPYSGYFIDGIIWPTASERSEYVTADPVNDLSESRDRIVVNNNPVTFKKGDSVFGQVITIGDVTYKNTYIINANASGTVTYGTINPNSWEIPYNYGTVTFR